MKNVLLIVGSLRKNSFNGQLAKRVAELLKDRANISLLDYRDVPFFSQDNENPTPEAILKVRAQIQAADGIWIFTPEYNAAVPGALKNLLDWLSRPLVAGDFSSGTAVMGKKVTLSGAGGKNATKFVRADLVRLLKFMRMEVIADEGTGIALDGAAFASDQLTISEDSAKTLQNQADTFLKAL